MPDVEEVLLGNLTQSLEDQLAHEAEMPAQGQHVDSTYFLPVGWRVGFICVHLSSEKRYSMLWPS